MGTTRGFREPEFQLVGSLIADVLDGLASGSNSNSKVEKRARKAAIDLCEKFPIYSEEKNP